MEQQTSTVHHNKSLERVISQRALQMSSSFSWMSWVVGFLFGILFTYFLLASMTSFTNPDFGRSSYSASPVAFSYNNSWLGDCRREKEKYLGGNSSINTGAAGDDDGRVEILYSAWSAVLNGSKNGDEFVRTVGLERSSVPYAPHLEDCDYNVDMYETFDRRVKEEDFPPWSIWKGSLGLELLRESNSSRKSMHEGSGADYPPWIVGSDEDNFPLTRRVQRDIWIHQHPLNCSDSNLRFLVADWEKSPGFGIGAQIVGMTGLLAIAINEKRTLVTNYYNRADHDGCKDSHRSRWSCYFLPETSQECRDRSLELLKHQEAWENGVITTKENYTSKEIWSGRIPRKWGSPWQYLQPTTVIEGSLVTTHRKMDLRWWRAQATRYLMRFKSSYTCNLLNAARHEAFGRDAAKMVVETLSPKWPQVTDVASGRSDYDAINRLVWSNHGPWMPKPMLSMHVRMGDKAVEMNVVGFEEYMDLADLLRQHLPNVNNIWLSTEMQEVTDKARRRRRRWNFYYTNVSRQVGNSSMASYEASLGRETSTNYPLVNFMMAVEADHFIGALGSTWCYLIDGMRNTGGKVMAGYLSVNRDRFW